MVKISIIYPNNKGARFDFGYYVDKHMPRSIELLAAHPGFRGVSVERGIRGEAPDSEAPYIAMCHFLFDTPEQFLEAFMPNVPELQADIPNYTDIEPVIQLSEVLIAR
jgi:uncharacterized protein (TIGR02118 family)